MSLSIDSNFKNKACNMDEVFLSYMDDIMKDPQIQDIMNNQIELPLDDELLRIKIMTREEMSLSPSKINRNFDLNTEIENKFVTGDYTDPKVKNIEDILDSLISQYDPSNTLLGSKYVLAEEFILEHSTSIL